MDDTSRLEIFNLFLASHSEYEHLEFKEAKSTFSREKIFEYVCAIANEGGGHLFLGVSDSHPRVVVGTASYPSIDVMNSMKLDILNKFGIRVEIYELFPNGCRVLDFQIPSRPSGKPLEINGRFLMRSGESVVPMSADQMRKILLEGEISWYEKSAHPNLSADEVVELLHTESIFDLLKLPYPRDSVKVCERLTSIKFVKETNGTFDILNLGAILAARDLSDFLEDISFRKPRIVVYSGNSKTETVKEFELDSGLAVGFEAFVTFAGEASPKNRLVEEVIRREIRTFPLICLRELIANAFVHQDFTIRGASVMVEMYSDRVEISNPGLPEIQVERFIDDWKSRNEVVADLMRRMGICEEKGSGVDKVINTAEVLQLPAPEFVLGASRTISILFAPKKFSEMTKADRIRACYQHCVLKYVVRKPMTNRSLRERFGLDDNQTGVISDIISATKEQGLIGQAQGSTNSTRHAQYVPFWAI